MIRDTPQHDDEIDIRILLLKLWTKRHIILMSIILCLVVGISIKLLKLHSSEIIRTASVEVIFTFPDVEKGVYPNGSTFSIKNLLSPSVLNTVYEKEGLAVYGIDRFKLLDYIEIVPFAPNREFIDAKYKLSLSNSNDFTQVELEEIGSRYKSDLENIRNRYAKLSISLPASITLPESVVVSVLNAIPEIWAKESIETYGVLDVGIAVPGRINKSYMEEDYIVASQYLKDFATLLLHSARKLAMDSVSRVLVDNQTGFSATDVATEITTLEQIKIQRLLNSFSVLPVSKDYEEFAFYLQSNVAAEEENFALMNREAKVIAEIFSQYTQRSVAQADSEQVSDENMRSNTRAIQLGDAFLSKLLSIGDELSDAKFEQSLLDKQLKVRLESEKIVSEIARLKTNYKNIENLKKDEVRNSYMKSIVESQISIIVEDLESYRATLERISELRKRRVLSNSGNMYNIASQPHLSSNISSQAKDLVFSLFLSLIVGCVLGISLAICSVVYDSVKSFYISSKNEFTTIADETSSLG